MYVFNTKTRDSSAHRVKCFEGNNYDLKADEEINFEVQSRDASRSQNVNENHVSQLYKENKWEGIQHARYHSKFK